MLGKFKGCGVGKTSSACSLESVNQEICKLCPNSGTLAVWLAWNRKMVLRIPPDNSFYELTCRNLNNESWLWYVISSAAWFNIL